MTPPVLSVIVAVQHARANLAAIVAALNPAAHPEVDFLFCYTDADAGTPGEVRTGSQARALSCAPGSLIPHLWRDGIYAARGDYVALTTAHCVPDAAWLDELMRLCRTDPVAVGGVIENDPDSDAKGWAIFLQRYIGFAPPQSARAIHEIAADNALYRRRDILAQADLLAGGFWEPSFHARFRAAGQTLRIDPSLHMWHRNRYSPGQFFRQHRDAQLHSARVSRLHRRFRRRDGGDRVYSSWLSGRERGANSSRAVQNHFRRASNGRIQRQHRSRRQRGGALGRKRRTDSHRARFI